MTINNVRAKKKQGMTRQCADIFYIIIEFWTVTIEYDMRKEQYSIPSKRSTRYELKISTGRQFVKVPLLRMMVV